MKRKELTKTFLMILNWKKTFWSPWLMQKYFSVVRVKQKYSNIAYWTRRWYCIRLDSQHAACLQCVFYEDIFHRKRKTLDQRRAYVPSRRPKVWPTWWDVKPRFSQLWVFVGNAGKISALMVMMTYLMGQAGCWKCHIFLHWCFFRYFTALKMPNLERE